METEDEKTIETIPIWHGTKKARPTRLSGITYNLDSPVGKIYVTINSSMDGQPFEVFVNTSKAGSETSAIGEALGRMISYNLRLASPEAPIKRLEETANQMSGIGGSRSVGFGHNKTTSLPDSIAHVLFEYIDKWKAEQESEDSTDSSQQSALFETALPDSDVTSPPHIGDICPECGKPTLVNEEGCCKCYSCGYSRC